MLRLIGLRRTILSYPHNGSLAPVVVATGCPRAFGLHCPTRYLPSSCPHTIRLTIGNELGEIESSWGSLGVDGSVGPNFVDVVKRPCQHDICSLISGFSSRHCLSEGHNFQIVEDEVPGRFHTPLRPPLQVVLMSCPTSPERIDSSNFVEVSFEYREDVDSPEVLQQLVLWGFCPDLGIRWETVRIPGGLLVASEESMVQVNRQNRNLMKCWR